MLTRLHITNFILIRELELDFEKGLTVITGETGSGKSIIIDALMLIFGMRITDDVIRNNETQCQLTAEFKLDNQLAYEWLWQHDLHDHDQPMNLICRRIINAGGKNKLYINGHVVTASEARELSEYILDIHTQHSSITLLRSETQRYLLDEYAKTSVMVSELSEYFGQIRKLEGQIADLALASVTLQIKKQDLADTLTELTSLNLLPNEWSNLEEQHLTLANTEVILTELSWLKNVIAEDENSVATMLRSAQNHLTKISEYSSQLGSLGKLFESISIDVAELNRELNATLSSIDNDPESLAAVEARIAAIHQCARKYNVSPELLPDFIENVKQELNLLSADSNIAELTTKKNELEQQYHQLAKIVTNQRQDAAKELEIEATRLLKALGINGVFRIALKDLPVISSYGMEDVEYQVAFNEGHLAQAISKAASGGELARLALVLYLLLSLKNSPEIVIFDEIDVGIGGKIASMVGDMLKQLGVEKQVICITHQPQTASFGDNHLTIAKANIDKRTTVEAKYVNKDERIGEIARMLSGATITATTLSHAREMLMHSSSRLL